MLDIYFFYLCFTTQKIMVIFSCSSHLKKKRAMLMPAKVLIWQRWLMPIFCAYSSLVSFVFYIPRDNSIGLFPGSFKVFLLKHFKWCWFSHFWGNRELQCVLMIQADVICLPRLAWCPWLPHPENVQGGGGRNYCFLRVITDYNWAEFSKYIQVAHRDQEG